MQKIDHKFNVLILVGVILVSIFLYFFVFQKPEKLSKEDKTPTTIYYLKTHRESLGDGVAYIQNLYKFNIPKHTSEKLTAFTSKNSNNILVKTPGGIVMAGSCSDVKPLTYRDITLSFWDYGTQRLITSNSLENLSQKEFECVWDVIPSRTDNSVLIQIAHYSTNTDLYRLPSSHPLPVYSRLVVWNPNNNTFTDFPKTSEAVMKLASRQYFKPNIIAFNGKVGEIFVLDEETLYKVPLNNLNNPAVIISVELAPQLNFNPSQVLGCSHKFG